ncbi:Uncharacterized protein Fot_47018 [Forsythia ovata]|uniref:Uncharacterized protein n=1 Tax=Forsythia ovata TaxID=205694 RepID=A0ABD1QQ05_9LAMI
MSVSRSHSGKSESESKKKPQGAEGNAAGIKGNGSKILIKFPCKNERKNQEEPRERGARENNGSENGANGGGGQKKEKRKLSFEISLSQREIEEDIYSLTGSRPNRRPKKRAKNVQKQLDDVFPGSWLASITPDSYKVLFFRVFRKLLIYSARRNSASLELPKHDGNSSSESVEMWLPPVPAALRQSQPGSFCLRSSSPPWLRITGEVLLLLIH